ncbi:MAG: DcrB-related protein [Deltaproteobacteria bacterium]|nr:DcrB-related protein [Deltaproteobacteria bacterium]
MPNLVLGDLSLEVPANWKDQGMVTLTLPSTDKKVRPNIIVTKERLSQPVDLVTYFDKIKQSVQARGIKSFEIVDEFDLDIGGIPAMEMVCKWDLSAMKEMSGGQNLDHIKEGQMVQQIQVSLIKDDYAVNFTASFPAEQFSLYERPFEKFITSLKFA